MKCANNSIVVCCFDHGSLVNSDEHSQTCVSCMYHLVMVNLGSTTVLL